MKTLLPYLKSYRKESVLGPLFKLLEAGFELFVPLVIAAMIDRGVGEGDTGFLLRMGGLLVGLGLIGLLCSVTAQYFAAKASVGFVKKLRTALFERITALSYRTLDRIGVSTLITRMSSDMNQVQTGLNLTLRLLLRSPFVVFGAMLMAFTVDAQTALWFAAAIPLLALVVFGVMLLSLPRYRRVQGQLDRVLGATRENLTGVRVLRAFDRQTQERADFAEQNDALTGLQLRVGRLSALLNPLTYVLINLAIVLLLRSGAIRVQSGHLTQGAVVALYNYMSQILVELIKLANLIINISKSLACGRRIRDALELPVGQDVDPALPGGDPQYAVALEQVGLRYHEPAARRGEEIGAALQGVELRVLPGQTVGVIGGTGSGKSSLVNLLPRFYTATEGRVLIGGTDVRAMDPAALRRKFGVVPQKAQLFQGTIRDNLRWGDPDADDAALLDAVRLAQADDVLAAKGGLDGMLEQNGRNLSGGQRQRLTIARALVRRPEILIRDDSASALDFATDAALRKALRSLDYRPTVFLVSQRSASLMHADQILVLDEGRPVGLGTHEALLSGCAVYREIYDSQFRQEAAEA